MTSPKDEPDPPPEPDEDNVLIPPSDYDPELFEATEELSEDGEVAADNAYEDPTVMARDTQDPGYLIDDQDEPEVFGDGQNR
jgi:hypothetical protein